MGTKDNSANSSDSDPQSGGLDSTTVNLTSLMSHASIVKNVGLYVADVVAATSIGKPYVMGETNSGKLNPSEHQAPFLQYSLILK